MLFLCAVTTNRKLRRLFSCRRVSKTCSSEWYVHAVNDVYIKIPLFVCGAFLRSGGGGASCGYHSECPASSSFCRPQCSIPVPDREHWWTGQCDLWPLQGSNWGHSVIKHDLEYCVSVTVLMRVLLCLYNAASYVCVCHFNIIYYYYYTVEFGIFYYY